MVDGHYKIGAIIQGRLGSTRLPNKILMSLPIGSNSTILSCIVNQLKTVSLLDKIILATSTKEINDPLQNVCGNLNIDCFRGDENDVLSRFHQLTIREDFDFILRFTADNPIIDTQYLEEFINYVITNKLDYCYSTNLPLGCNFEMMRSSEILKAYQTTNSEYDKEHVTSFIRREAKKKSFYVFNSYQEKKKLRLTIDYPSDYAFIQMIFSMLGSEPKTLEVLNALINKNEWLLEINRRNFQKQVWNSIEDEIENIMPIVKERELQRLQKILENV